MKTILFLILLLPVISSAQLSVKQEAEVDSLKQLIETANHDSIRINNWIAWGDIVNIVDPALDIVLNRKVDSLCDLNLNKNQKRDEKKFFLKSKADALSAIGKINERLGNYEQGIENYTNSLKIYEQIGDEEGVAICLNGLGLIYRFQGEYEDAIHYFKRSLTIREEIGNETGVASCLNNLGVIYFRQGEYDQAMQHYTKSLKIREEIGNKIGMASCLNNIAGIHFRQDDFTKAIEYCEKSLKIKKELGDKAGMATSYSGIGMIYKSQKDYAMAMQNYSKCLSIEEELGDIRGMANSYNNIAVVYENQGNLPMALEYLNKSLKIREKIGDKMGMGSTWLNIGNIYLAQGNSIMAKNYYERSLAKAQEVGSVILIRNVSEMLWIVNKKLGKYKESLAMYELSVNARDSINSEENQKEVMRLELQYNFEKQADSIAIEQVRKDELALAEEKRKEDVAKKENEKKNQIIMFVIAGLLLLIIFTFFVINRLRITHKQKEIIEEQKIDVENAHTEITDSINYAKRLQNAILPSLKEVEMYLPNNFILFKPKNVVSGDFYWFEELNGTAYIAAADCTGHGVPGAMVSVVCSNALHRCVKEFGITSPAEILDKTRALVIETFAKSGEGIKDGMDLALCSFSNKKVTYSGANNPLWIIRKTELISAEQFENKSTLVKDDLTLIEYKANKQPIGLHAEMTSFTEEEINLFPGDLLYLFTDGFADQFGGEKGKKLKYKPFKQLLLDHSAKPIAAQAQHFEDYFEKWKGNYEQVDDVCLIGIQIA